MSERLGRRALTTLAFPGRGSEPARDQSTRSASSRATVWELAVEALASVKADRHEADAVEAVLGATGHRVSRRREGPADLAPREVVVLRLVARGLSKQGDRRVAGDLPEDGRQPP
jgi:hypothetical protein